MTMTVAEIARRLGASYEGDGEARIAAVAGLAEARPGDLSFLSNPRYRAAMATTAASAVLVGTAWQGETRAAVIRVADPDAAFAEVAAWFGRPAPPVAPGVHPTAIVAADAVLGEAVAVGPFCVIEPGVHIGARTVLGACCYVGHAVSIGADCRFHPHVTVREYCRIGSRVIIHNGAVIGSDGFGYTRGGGHWHKIPQVGIVVIEDDVEIGANTTIDRARFGATHIGRGVKIDNLVQVAHNVTIGDDTAIAAQVGIAGSTRIGRRVQIGGQAGVTGHVQVDDDAVLGAQSGVSKDVPAGTFVFGTPAAPREEAFRAHANVMRLPELKARIAQIEARLRALEGRGS